MSYRLINNGLSFWCVEINHAALQTVVNEPIYDGNSYYIL